MIAEREGDGVAETSSKATRSYAGVHVARFTVVDVLGDGPIARVFRVEDIESSGQIALKVFKQKIRFRGRQYRSEQLAQQARGAAALAHTNILPVHEIGEESDVYHVAMEWATQGSLRQMVLECGRLPIWDACSYVAQVADALAYAHGRGILHRDIKPSNLLLCASGRCKLSDFGMAPTADRGHLYTLPLEALGRPRYVAPEVLRGEQPTASADIYSLGAVLFYLLAGRPAFEAETFDEVRMQHWSSAVPNLCTLRPDVPPDLTAIIRRAMAKYPEARFADATSFATAVREQLAQMPAPPKPPVEARAAHAHAPPAELPRNVVVGAVAALALGVLIICTVLAFRLVSSTPAATGKAAGMTQILTPSAMSARVESATPPATWGTRLIAATDLPSLTIVASSDEGSEVTVEGKVVRAAISPTGESVELAFADGDTGFRCVYYPASDMFGAMESEFGGSDGIGIQGKTVRVTGTIRMAKGRPQIIIASPEQVQEKK